MGIVYFMLKYSKEKSFSLVELMVVLIIIGILASIALPNYNKIKERAIDKEAIANLKLIQAAEKIYKMEIGGYYSNSGASNINTNLKLDLTEKNWQFGANSLGTGKADRVSGGRNWTINIGDSEPCCTGADCPAGSGC